MSKTIPSSPNRGSGEGVCLSPHFSLSEFTASATAQRLGIDNTPTDVVVANLTNLCQRVLEPLRQAYGRPIIVSSGYRSKALNKAVGGVSSSQHTKGEAADLHFPTLKIGRMWYLYIKEHLPYDQLILEHDRKGNYWLHVSCKADITHNRQQAIGDYLKN